MSGTRRTSSKSYGTTAIASSPWIVVSVGVAVMVVLLAIALGAYRGRGPAFDAQPGPPLPTVGLADPGAVGGQPDGHALAAGDGHAVRPLHQPAHPDTGPRPPAAAPRRRRPPAGARRRRWSAAAALGVPADAAGTGWWSRTRTGFVGEVLVGNTSSAGREWTTRLTFPGARLGSAWIEGAPQGTAQRIDDGFTYRSGGDLPGGASVTLRFYVQGTQSRPTSCTVDGVSCRL